MPTQTLQPYHPGISIDGEILVLNPHDSSVLHLTLGPARLWQLARDGVGRPEIIARLSHELDTLPAATARLVEETWRQWEAAKLLSPPPVSYTTTVSGCPLNLLLPEDASTDRIRSAFRLIQGTRSDAITTVEVVNLGGLYLVLADARQIAITPHETVLEKTITQHISERVSASRGAIVQFPFAAMTFREQNLLVACADTGGEALLDELAKAPDCRLWATRIGIGAASELILLNLPHFRDTTESHASDINVTLPAQSLPDTPFVPNRIIWLTYRPFANNSCKPVEPEAALERMMRDATTLTGGPLPLKAIADLLTSVEATDLGFDTIENGIDSLSDVYPDDLSQQAAEVKRPRTLILYSHYDDKNYEDNLAFFLRHGLNDSDEFVFVVNGDGNVSSQGRRNVTCFNRENFGLDFGGWNDALLRTDITRFDRFIFLNSTVRGPFLPLWAARCDWVDLFCSQLDDTVKLSGPSINFHFDLPHVQSMAFCTDQIGLRVALDHGIFGAETLDYKPDVGSKREAALSRAIIDAGFRIHCFLSAYSHIDWSKAQPFGLAANDHGGDPLLGRAYFGGDLHPFEAMFIKSARGIDEATIERLTQWYNGKLPAGPLAPIALAFRSYVALVSRIHAHRILTIGKRASSAVRFFEYLSMLNGATENDQIVAVDSDVIDRGKVPADDHQRIRVIDDRALNSEAPFDLVIFDLDELSTDAANSLKRACAKVGGKGVLALDWSTATLDADVLDTWLQETLAEDWQFMHADLCRDQSEYRARLLGRS